MCQSMLAGFLIGKHNLTLLEEFINEVVDQNSNAIFMKGNLKRTFQGKIFKGISTQKEMKV